MKRFFTWLLALCLLSCAFVVPARAEDEKQIFVKLSQAGDLYRADLVWTGAAAEDDIGGIQFSFSYDRSFFTVEKYALGASLKDFSIKMGPENKESYPLIFLGASGSAAVETEGTLASVWLTAKDGAAGATVLEIKDLSLVRFSDNQKLTDLYTVQNLDLSLSSGTADQTTEVFCVSENGELVAPPASDPEDDSGDASADFAAPVTDDSYQNDAPEKTEKEEQTPADGEDLTTVGATGEKPGEQTEQPFVITLIVAISCILLAVAVAVLFAVVQRRRKKEASLAAAAEETVAPGASDEAKEDTETNNGDPE